MIVEEKFGPQSIKISQEKDKEHGSSFDEPFSDSSSDSEDEDDEGVFASENLDAQIQATLEAIRNKDPRVYDGKTTFYAQDEEAPRDADLRSQKVKPMYLNDYHRRNILQGSTEAEPEDEKPLTYEQQQNDLRQSVVKELQHTIHLTDAHASQPKEFAVEQASDGDEHDDDDNDGFLVQKLSVPLNATANAQRKSRAIAPDPKVAEIDPDTFLTDFMSARAWIPSDASKLQPFESDDEEEDRRAEAFEEAYNLRFENPKDSNEKLVSHARDIAVKYSVRKETTNVRKRAREKERADKEVEKQKRQEEKNRLRKLKIAEAEEKLSKIGEAAGLALDQLKAEDWSTLLNEGWDDSRWDAEMKIKFGDKYYTDYDHNDKDELHSAKRKIRKPKWKDDVFIDDLIPESKKNEGYRKNKFTLMSDGSDLKVSEDQLDEIGKPNPPEGYISSTGSYPKQERSDEEVRRKRRKIERHVDETIYLEKALSEFGTKHSGHFRYRETTPQAFGLTAHDILMADDSQLNQYAGLKKMAAFRDVYKKKRDRKLLGKKARLRQWRRETFGNEEGPQTTLKDFIAKSEPSFSVPAAQEVENRRKSKSRKAKARPNG